MDNWTIINNAKKALNMSVIQPESSRDALIKVIELADKLDKEK